VIGAVIAVIVTLIVLLALFFVALPYARLQAKRREAWGRIPQPEELWVQNKGLLYIDATDATGIDLISIDPESGRQVHKWKDSWEDWQRRLKAHTVFYTGQRRPLGPVV
jgi:hypothetical protein